MKPKLKVVIKTKTSSCEVDLVPHRANTAFLWVVAGAPDCGSPECHPPNKTVKPGKRSEWQLRVIDERDELVQRIDKLTIFLLGKESSKLDSEDRDLLIEQRECMSSYLRTINKRIDRF